MTFEFPMWTDGNKRLLDVVLKRIPEALSWRLLWFDGTFTRGATVRPPIDEHLDLAISDSDLRNLAASLIDLDSIVLVAGDDGGTLRLECEDSDRWLIEGSGSLANAEERFEDLR